MLAQILNLRRNVAAALLFVTAVMLVSCASQKEQVALVNDPDAHNESQIPWNRQEKWETGAQLAGLADQKR
jgi:hypothetical protein